MKFDVNSLPNDPEQLKQMLLELQQRIDEELIKKNLAYQVLLEHYISSLLTNTVKPRENAWWR
jgi:transposase